MVGIGRTGEMVGVTDLEVVPAGVCVVTVTTDKESYTERGAFGVADTLHHWEAGILDLASILDVEYVFEGEGPRCLKHSRSFVRL